MAISDLAKKKKREKAETAGSSRSKRTGNLGRHLFLYYCIICKTSGAIKVKIEKQFSKKLDLESAEKAIREAASLKGDQGMLEAIEGVSPLPAAEFRVHEKCRRSYTHIFPPKSKRVKVDERLKDELRDDVNDLLSIDTDEGMTVNDQTRDDLIIENGEDEYYEADDVILKLWPRQKMKT